MPAARFPPARAAQLLAYLALANAATAAASWLVLEDERERSTDPSYWTVDENYDFKGETRLLSEPDFQRIFRLSRTGFDEVLGRIEHDVVTGNRCNSRRAGPIPADVKLAVTPRYGKTAKIGVFCFFSPSFAPLFFLPVFFGQTRERVERGCAGARVHAFCWMCGWARGPRVPAIGARAAPRPAPGAPGRRQPYPGSTHSTSILPISRKMRTAHCGA